MDEDRCIVCGEIIPEGRMVCPKCEYIGQSSDTTKPNEEIDYRLIYAKNKGGDNCLKQSLTGYPTIGRE